MNAHVQAQINAAKAGNSSPAARSGAPKGKTSADPNEGHSTKEYATIQAARRQAVGYGYRADTNTTFGVPVFVRTYRLLHEAEAARLDALFYEISNPEQ